MEKYPHYFTWNPIDNSTLELNSVSLFANRNSIYNNYVQPYQHNSNSPLCGLNTYSFALVPEEQQPSGFCNFNKLHLVNISFLFNPQFAANSKDILIYAHSYNILQYMHGKVKLLFNL